MSRALRRACVCAAAGLTALPLVWAAPATPTVWQQRAPGEQVGKLANWSRDRLPPRFVDDLLADRPLQDRVDVIVDFNRPLTLVEVKSLLDPFGTVDYVGRVLSFALLSNVLVRDLPRIGQFDQVAMVEWQVPIRLASDVASRAIQARASCEYEKQSAEDLGLSGKGVTVAILDSGIDTEHLAFRAKGFRAALDATVCDSCPLTPINPAKDLSAVPHGTQVASIALGGLIPKEQAPDACRRVDADCGEPVVLEADCGGVATGAGLLDLKVCISTTCDAKHVDRGLDWLVENVGLTGSIAENVKVANLSFTMDADDDGKSSLSQLVNSLVWRGVTVVAAHGNDDPPTLPAGPRASFSPGAASLALTVGGVDDDGSVWRDGDFDASFGLIGPRCDPSVCTPQKDDEKPELCAPGERIAGAVPKTDATYLRDSGTSFAAPVVAGATAIVLEHNRAMDPSSIKDLLERTADPDPRHGPGWSPARGYGTVNVGAAVSAVASSDVGFAYCDPGAIATAGEPCPLKSPATGPGENDQDIVVQAPPLGSSASHEIRATVTNWGATAERVRVQFVDRSTTHPQRWTAIGTQEVTVPGGGTAVAVQPWTPPVSGALADVQVRIAFGLDTNYANNLTQRNAALVTPYSSITLANPYGEAAQVWLMARAAPPAWSCKLSQTSFVMRADELTHPISWTLIPPKNTDPAARGTCFVGSEIRPVADQTRVFRDSAAFQSFAPRPCQAQLRVVDGQGHPIRRARVRLRESISRESGSERVLGRQPEQRRLRTDRRGEARVKLVPYLPYHVEVRAGKATFTGTLRTLCGDPATLVLDGERLVAFSGSALAGK